MEALPGHRKIGSVTSCCSPASRRHSVPCSRHAEGGYRPPPWVQIIGPALWAPTARTLAATVGSASPSCVMSVTSCLYVCSRLAHTTSTPYLAMVRVRVRVRARARARIRARVRVRVRVRVRARARARTRARVSLTRPVLAAVERKKPGDARDSYDWKPPCAAASSGSCRLHETRLASAALGGRG